MNKLLIACMSAAFVLSVNAADWFNGGLSGATKFGGDWSEGTTFTQSGTIDLEDGEVAFTVAEGSEKSLDTDVVTITSTVALTAYDEVPEVAEGTKAALAPVNGKYYGLVKGVFVELTGATPKEEPVGVTIQLRKTNDKVEVKYAVDGVDLTAEDAAWLETDVEEAPTEVAYAGVGTVSTLVGTTEAMAATVGFEVIIAEGANVEATVKIDGETVETVPSTLTEGQTYAVTFAPVEGYMFETAPEPVSGTVGKDNITVNAPTAVKIVAMAGEVPCASLQAALKLGGTVKLADNVAVGEWQIVDKAVTLDLNGKTLAAKVQFTGDAVIAVKHGGSLTVKNGTIDGESVMCGIKLTQNASDAVAEYTEANKAVLVVDAGATVIGKTYGIAGNGNPGRGNTAVTIKEGAEVKTSDPLTEAVAIYNPQAGTVDVEGGLVEGHNYGIYAKSGTVTISGGTVKATAKEADAPVAYNDGVNGKGYAVVLEKGTASGGYANGLTATITGGTFESVGAPVLSWTRDDETAPALAGLITDGKFKGGEMDAALIAAVEGKEASWTTDSEGYFVPAWTDIPVLADAKYSETFNGSRGNPSTKVGGTAFTYASWDWPTEQTYTAVRGDESDKALVLADNCTPGNNANATAGGSISFLTVAKMANSTTAPKVIACVSGNANNTDSTGMLLVYQDRKVKLVNYKRTTDGVDVLAEYTDENIEKQFHSYLVTFNKDTMEAALFVDGKIQGSVKTARFVPGQMYQIGSIIGAVGNVSVDGVACQKGAGIAIDEFALWDEDISAFAQDVADKYAVWPTINTLVWDNTKSDWNSNTQAYDGDTLVDIGEYDTIVFRNFTGVLYDKRDNKTALDLEVESGTLKIGHPDTDGNNLPDGSTVTIKQDARVELRCWDNATNPNTRSVNIPGTVTFNGPGSVSVEEHIWDVTLGTVNGTAPINLGNAINVTVTGTIAQPISGAATVKAYTGLQVADTWTGTVVVPETDSPTSAQLIPLASYGNENSTIVMKGLTGKTWLGGGTQNIAATVRLDGFVEFTNGSTGAAYNFAKLTGTGDLKIATWNSSTTAATYTIAEVSGYTGTITNGFTNTSVTKIVVAAAPETETVVLKTAGETLANTPKVFVGETELSADDYEVTVDANGVKVTPKASPIQPIDPTKPTEEYASPEAAAAAAEAINANKAELIAKPFDTMTDADKATYDGYVTAKVVGNTVVVDFSEDGKAALQPIANAAVKDDEILDTTSATATVAAKPGFYYAIVGGTDVNAITTAGTAVQATGDTVTLTKPDLGATTKAFYKVKMSVTK